MTERPKDLSIGCDLPVPIGDLLRLHCLGIMTGNASLDLRFGFQSDEPFGLLCRLRTSTEQEQSRLVSLSKGYGDFGGDAARSTCDDDEVRRSGP